MSSEFGVNFQEVSFTHGRVCRCAYTANIESGLHR